MHFSIIQPCYEKVQQTLILHGCGLSLKRRLLNARRIWRNGVKKTQILLALHEEVVDAGDLREHVAVARAEVHHDRRVAFSALRRIRVGDRGADARRVSEFHGHVLDGALLLEPGDRTCAPFRILELRLLVQCSEIGPVSGALRFQCSGIGFVLQCADTGS